MKNNIYFISKLIFFIIIFISLPTHAQVIEIGTKQNYAISGPTSLPFSITSNTIIKSNFPTNPSITLDISSYFGSPLKFKALADNVDIGSTIEVRQSGVYTLDISMASPNANNFSLSAIPLFGPSVFTLAALSTKSPSNSSSSSSGAIAPSTSSGGFTSTSSGGITTSSSSGGISFTKATLTLSGPDTLTLSPHKSNTIKLTAKTTEFSSIITCQVFTSNDLLLNIKPRIFLLSNNKNEQIIRVNVPILFANNLITTNTSKTVRINVTCDNKARDEITLLIEP